MAGNRHAVLSPSASARWLSCPPSARLEEQFKDSSGEAAAEGTAAHALAEHKLNKMLKRRSCRPHSSYDSDEMEECTDGYVSFVMEQIQIIDKPFVCVEQHLDLTNFVPEAYGTADCLIVGSGIVHVIDFKFGRGVLIDAERNPQLMLYALGALDMLSNLYDISEARMSIYQPRREHVSTWSVSVDEMLDWAEKELKPGAQLAFAGKGEYAVGVWCHFCRASPRCRARAKAQLESAKGEFRLPPLLTDDEIAELLPRLPELARWVDEVSAYALDMAANHGKSWPGFKLVAGRSIRKYADADKVVEAARKAGFTDIFDRKLIPVTQMEKLMGKEKFNEVLGGLIFKPQGKPTLVLMSDKRPAINVGNEFSNLEEKEHEQER